MSRNFGVYVNPDVDPQGHARWILGQMGAWSPPPSYTSSSEDEDKETPVLLELNPALSNRTYNKFKYVKKKNGQPNYSNCPLHCPNSDSDGGSDSGSSSDSSGSGSSVYSSGSIYASDCDSTCDSTCEGCTQMEVYIPVSCSKKCKNCFGRSPGCGRNYGFKNIMTGLNLCDTTCNHIKTKSSEANLLFPKYATLVVTERH